MLSYASESTPAKTSENLKDELRGVNRELTSMKRQWQEERRKLLGDNAVLKDAADHLNLQIQDARERAEQKERTQEKARTGVLGVWPISILENERFADILEFTGPGRGERNNSRVGR